MNDLLDRISGALLGGLCGDAVGRPAECLHHRAIEERFGRITGPMAQAGRLPGDGTDDSALKHLLCEAIVAADGEVTPRDWARLWRERMKPDDYWIPVQNAYFKLMVQDVPPDEVGVGNMVSNSSAMCIAPVGIVNAGDPRAASREALSVARLIHRGYPLEAAGVVAAAVAAALSDDASPETVLAAATAYLPADSEMTPAVEAGAALARASDSYDDFRARFYDRLLRPWPHRHEGWSTAVDPRESVPAALGVFLLANGEPEETILGCANFGRDADTIATIGGAVAGALRGAGALPTPWVEAVRAANPVDQDELAASLLAVLGRRAEHAAAWGRGTRQRLEAEQRPP